MAKATEDKLGELHGLVADQLSERIKEGLWSSADIAAAIKFLKDNNITSDPGEDSHLAGLKQQLEQAAKSRPAGQQYSNIDELAEIAQQEINDGMWKH